LSAEKSQNWCDHPLGKALVINAIEFFENRKNVQQVSMVAALLLAQEI